MEFFVEPEHWDFDNNRPKETCPDKDILESLISNKISEARSKIVKLKAGYKGFSATSLIEKLSKDLTCDSRRIVQERDKFINSLREGKRTGYTLSVEQVYNSLVKFNKTLSKILCKWKQDSVVGFFLYLDSVFKNKHKLIHNQSPV